MASIQQVIYSHIKNSVTMQTNFNGVFYIVNDNKVKAPYATIFGVDDPREIKSLCALDQGQTRIQCDSFTTTVVKGIDVREIYISVIKELQATTTLGVNIYNIEIINVVDRSDTINGLFQFSFEAIIYWEK